MKWIIILITLVVSCEGDKTTSVSAIPHRDSHHDSMLVMFHIHDSLKHLKDSCEALTYRYFDTAFDYSFKAQSNIYTSKADYYIGKAELYQRKANETHSRTKHYFWLMDSTLRTTKL